jgi:hypothetical protein
MIEVAIVFAVSLIVLTGLITQITKEHFPDYNTAYKIQTPQEILADKKFDPKPMQSEFSYKI